jgi:hypothetical protein
VIAADAASADADDDRRYFFLGFDGGWAWATGEGSDLWRSGASAGINFFYPLTSHFSIGGRAALDRWILDGDAAVDAIVPPGATVTSYASDGTLRIIEITPLLRLSVDHFLWKRMAGFLQIGGGLYRVSFEAETIAEYTSGGRNETVVAGANGSEYRGGLTAGAGVSFTIHGDSRLDIYPAYNAIFENKDTTEYLTLLIAFRVEFSPWEDR